MADYKEKFGKWQRDAKEKFEEIDNQLGLKEKLGESARAVLDTAQKGAEKIKAEAEKSEAGKHAIKLTEDTLKTAEETAKKAWNASEPIRGAAGDAGEKAGAAAKDLGARAADVFADVRQSVGVGVRRVSSVFNFGVGWTRTFDSAFKALGKTSDWVQEKPVEAAATGVSMAVGAGLGVIFTGISSHWLFNSALPAWSIKKISDQFNDYLGRREDLIAKGELSAADAERARFEREIAKRIGAPLLGAFSFASGAVMMTNVLNPKTITGAPLDWLIGGSPLLESVWFFGNGMVCFKTSYDFFMIALDGQEDVQRMVKEIKGLLPEDV